MTPTQILTAARNKYNAVGDSFYSDDELLHLIYEGSVILATEAKCIERVFSTSTVASQQEYTYPTSLIEIKRITYNGEKLKPVNFREDDSLTLGNAATTSTGTPQYYSIWNETIYLRPIPSAVGTLKIFGCVEPQIPGINSTLEVPSMLHIHLVNYVVSEMCDKDENDRFAQKYMEKFLAGVTSAKRWSQKKKRGDAFAVVQDEESLSETILGST